MQAHTKGVLLLLVFVVCAYANQSATLSYQIHSYNDLREWMQTLKKATLYFKIDPHYMPHSFCATQDRVDQMDPRGCFVLNHDQPASTRTYDSLDDVLTLISNPAYSNFFQSANTKITISLCFKLDDISPCDGSQAAANWTSLIDDFHAEALSVTEKQKLNVEFILDGASTPSKKNQCLAQKWRPWVSTWIPGDCDEAPFSNNATLGLDRFQVFNPPSVDLDPGHYIKVWEAQKYAKFGNTSSPYPYLFWEPSDQKTILKAADDYLAGPIHPAGFRFAINTDPAQLEVFVGSRSGVSWNYNIVRDAGSSAPISAVIYTSPDTTKFSVLTVYTSNQKSYYTLSTSAVWSAEALGTVTATAPKVFPANFTVTSVRSILLEGQNFVFAGGDEGQQALFGFTAGQIASPPLFYENGRSDTTSVYRSSIATNSDSSFFVVQLVQRVGASSCQLSHQLWSFTKDKNQFRSQLVSPLQCLDVGVNVTTFSFDFASVKSAPSDYLSGIIMIGDGGNIYAAQIYSSKSGKGVVLNDGVNGSALVGVGSNPSVSIKNSVDGRVKVLEVHQDGYCWNCEVHNKRPLPGLCDSAPLSLNGILNYNLGTYQVWHDSIVLAVKTKDTNTYFNPCDTSMFHGTYDSGSEPNVILFDAVDSTKTQTTIIAATHIALSDHTKDTEGCGLAVSGTGIVLDSWPLLKWSL